MLTGEIPNEKKKLKANEKVRHLYLWHIENKANRYGISQVKVQENCRTVECCNDHQTADTKQKNRQRFLSEQQEKAKYLSTMFMAVSPQTKNVTGKTGNMDSRHCPFSPVQVRCHYY